MKPLSHFTLFLISFVFVANLNASVIPPRLSLLSSITQKIGLTDVTITYSRPNVKGREIFGGLVPYGEVWRTGANRATTLTLETNAMLNGNPVPEGTYSLFTLPGEDIWTVVINKIPGQFGAFTYDSGEDLLRFEVSAQKLNESVESFEIRFSNVHDSQTDVELRWDDTFVVFNIAVTEETNHQQMMDSIERDVIGVSEPEWRDLGEAARYYIKTDYKLKKALSWLEKCNEIHPDAWWMFAEKAKLLKKLNHLTEAITAVEKMIEICTSIDHKDGIKWGKSLLAEME